MKILFLDGTKGFNPGRIESKPTGGIINSLIILPRILSLKHEVYVAGPDIKEQEIGGVHYNNFARCVVPDVVVFNRNFISRDLIRLFDCPKVWWLHDICDPRYLDDDGFRFVDSAVALSKYNVETYKHFYELPEEKFTIIPNGVDRSLFYPGAERNSDLYICASAPIKGLQPIEYVYQNMKRINPRFELRVYSSAKLHDFENNLRVEKMLSRFKDIGVNVIDPVPQAELAEVMRQAWCLLMPNHYPEICSNLLLQAQACGLPVVATNIGSVGEFVTHGATGLLTSWLPDSPFNWWKDFTELAMNLYLKPAQHKLISRVTPGLPKSWEQIGEMWNEHLCQLHSISKYRQTKTLAI